MSTPTTAPKVLAHLRASNEISRRFQAVLEKEAAETSAVRAALPAAMAALEDNDRIYGHQKQTVMEKLASSHAACIELIRDLAKHRNAAELEAIGNPVHGTEKKASASPLTGAAVADFDETASGAAFRQKLLGR